MLVWGKGSELGLGTKGIALMKKGLMKGGGNAFLATALGGGTFSLAIAVLREGGGGKALEIVYLPYIDTYSRDPCIDTDSAVWVPIRPLLVAPFGRVATAALPFLMLLARRTKFAFLCMSETPNSGNFPISNVKIPSFF